VNGTDDKEVTVFNRKTVRTMGMFGAIGVGVGAIVGGGILALAGVAFATTGPSAILAFALNGFIAIITALSFAELSSSFPESGGTYVFSKKVLSIRAAFSVGWVVWFASIVAAVLYALGAGHFISIALGPLASQLPGNYGSWITTESIVVVIAVVSIIIYSGSLIRKPGGGGEVANIGKLTAFAILIVAGLWALPKESLASIKTDYTPFLAFGTLGLIQAMGYTFIAFQGFDLIAAVAGEVKSPEKTIPKAMIISLLIATAIYLPILFIITVAGTKLGVSITDLSIDNPESIIAITARTFLGKFGFWLVVAAAILSMLSALYANILAASRIAQSMARDRTLPRFLGSLYEKRGTPANAILATSVIVVATLLVIPDIGSAGAAASLIFLITFALAQWITILARTRRRDVAKTFRIPLFPYLPIFGIAACVGLAIFQGIVVPSAGLIALFWLAIGGVLYLILFARSARIYDASSEGFDPELVRLRGRTPLVLVPIANPTNAAPMVAVAKTLAPPAIGKVLLLSVVSTDEEWNYDRNKGLVVNAQDVLREAISASVDIGLSPEALITIAKRPWPEIIRVAETYRCESLLVGLTRFTEKKTEKNLEKLINSVNSDVVILRAPHEWQIFDAKKILVPVGGRGSHGELLARVLGSISRSGSPEITYLRVLPENSDWRKVDRARNELFQFAADQAVQGNIKIKVEKANDIAEQIISHVTESDLVILGIQSLGRHRRSFGDLTLRIAKETSCPILMISRRH
jgi:APA family basic amino acid/polyamine antiporter